MYTIPDNLRCPFPGTTNHFPPLRQSLFPLWHASSRLNWLAANPKIHLSLLPLLRDYKSTLLHVAFSHLFWNPTQVLVLARYEGARMRDGSLNCSQHRLWPLSSALGCSFSNHMLFLCRYLISPQSRDTRTTGILSSRKEAKNREQSQWKGTKGLCDFDFNYTDSLRKSFSEVYFSSFRIQLHFLPFSSSMANSHPLPPSLLPPPSLSSCA